MTAKPKRQNKQSDGCLFFIPRGSSFFSQEHGTLLCKVCCNIRSFTPVFLENISYLLSLIHYLLLKPPVVQTVFVFCSAGLLFQAESVGASLEAPGVLCPMQPRKNPTKSRRFALIFRSAQREKTGASSDAPTDFTFMLFIYG